MKILEINFFIGGGGASRLLVDLCNHFASEDNIVEALITNDERKYKSSNYISFKDDLNKNVRCIELNAKSGISLKTIWGIFRYVKTNKPDVVHCHCSILLLALPALFLKKTKYIHTIHTLVTRTYPGGWIKKIAYWLYKTKRIIPVTISEECRKSYFECFGTQEDVLIINGRDELTTSEKKSEVLEELENKGIILGDNIPIFIHVSRHHPVKNHDRMFDTFERIGSEGIPYHLIIIGDNYECYDKQYSNHPNIHLIGPKTNIGDYMSLSTFYVISSDKEGLPLSLLEAMSMGVIPICTPAGGIKDVLRDGENGYMGNVVSDDEFYKSVKKAISEYGAISRESLVQEYQSKYTMDICAKKYWELYNS